MSSTNVLKGLREAAGLSQRDLAKEVGISRTKVYDLENKKDLTVQEAELFSESLAKTIDLAYVSGLFDRASIFSITRIAPGKLHDHQKSPAYVASIRFSSNHKILVDILKQVFGVGKVCPQKQTDSKIRWIYYAHNKNVDTVLEKLIPYLRLKREKALVLKEFRSFLAESRDAYRSSGASIGSLVLPEQDLTSRVTFSTSQFVDLYSISDGAVRAMLTDGRLKFKMTGRGYRIFPFKHDGGKITRTGAPMADEVLAKYEEFYKRIREA